MQCLTCVVFINLAHYYGRDCASHARGQLTISLVHIVSFPDQCLWHLTWERDYMWHAYKFRKWHPSQRTATTECCKWLLLTRVNLKQWRRWMVRKLRAVMSISFMLKSRQVLELFSSYRCLASGPRRKMALLLPHTFPFSYLPHGFWPLIWVSLITKALKENA